MTRLRNLSWTSAEFSVLFSSCLLCRAPTDAAYFPTEATEQDSRHFPLSSISIEQRDHRGRRCRLHLFAHRSLLSAIIPKPVWVFVRCGHSRQPYAKPH